MAQDELLNDPDINVIVEVIDDANAAFKIVATALKSGKDVVSASKKMIAEHLPEHALSGIRPTLGMTAHLGFR